MIESFAEWLSWVESLDRGFVFLLLLPMLVAGAGLARHLYDRCRAQGKR